FSYAYIARASLFFFQAEDGIRYATVTGVQTCALPILKLAILILSLGSIAAAQSKSPVSDFLKERINGVEKNTVGAFEEMPADKYEFKPTADQMTFGHLAPHIVEANN